jgi:hypothetical protein
MSQHHRDHEDVLRRALHSAVDSMEVSGDGLERIQARLTTPRPAPLAWVMAAPSEVARRALIGLSAVWAWLQPLAAWMVARARGGGKAGTDRSVRGIGAAGRGHGVAADGVAAAGARAAGQHP